MEAELITAISHYALEYDGASDLAYEAAHQALIESLACALRSLRSPDCVRLVGPVVPGATMARGARVPGTSYELDPVQAAFSLGAMTASLESPAAGIADSGSSSLGAILGVADWQARSALAEARTPPTVREVLRRMIQAAELHEALTHAAATGPLLPARVGATAVVTAMLAGTREQVVVAVSNAFLDGPSLHAQPRRERWLAADVAARAVRLALLAVKGGAERSSAITAGDRAASTEREPASLQQNPPFGCRAMERAHVPAEDALASTLRFEATVTAHYPAGQAEKIKALFRDRPRLDSLPVNEIVSILVRN